MRSPAEIIRAKRDGGSLNASEIAAFVPASPTGA